MRTTLVIDDATYRKASELTGIKEKKSLVRMGLETLISKESGKRLAMLGGSEGHLKNIRRRRIVK
jgi:Arc/MetJ family transcription regulator